MKVVAVIIAGASLIAAGTATAGSRISDLDYLRANRCKGIAEGLGADTAGVDALLKDARRSRADVILQRGEAELKRGKRETRGEMKEKVSAELANGCSAYMHGDSQVAKS